MTAVAELQSCDGFSVESPEGLVGWVEETWLDDSRHPAALAVRTPSGSRALLLTDAIRAVDADTQQVLVAAQPRLLELDAPRIANADSLVVAEPTLSPELSTWPLICAEIGWKISIANSWPQRNHWIHAASKQ